MGERQKKHLAAVSALLNALSDDLTIPEAIIALEDASVAVHGGHGFALTVKQMKAQSLQAIEDVLAESALRESVKSQNA